MKPESGTTHTKSRLVQMTFGVALGVICLALAATVFASWPANVIAEQRPQGFQADVRLTLPQTWAFFTRSPEVSSVVPYRQDVDGKWQRVDTLPQSSPANLLGLSRNQRAQGTELALITGQVRKLRPCADYLSRCLSRQSNAVEQIENPDSHPFFCGRMRLVLQEPVKWSFRNETPEGIRAISFVDVELTCPK